MSEATEKPVYRVPFVERTGMRKLEEKRGYSKLLMPLEQNANHVSVMYMGAFTVLAEAAAAGPGISILDTAKYFPIIKDIYVDFHRMAASDVTAEYSLSNAQIDALLSDLEAKGRATYVADIPMLDRQGSLVATGKVTVKLLSHDWPPKDAG